MNTLIFPIIIGIVSFIIGGIAIAKNRKLQLQSPNAIDIEPVENNNEIDLNLLIKEISTLSDLVVSKLNSYEENLITSNNVIQQVVEMNKILLESQNKIAKTTELSSKMIKNLNDSLDVRMVDIFKQHEQINSFTKPVFNAHIQNEKTPRVTGTAMLVRAYASMVKNGFIANDMPVVVQVNKDISSSVGGGFGNILMNISDEQLKQLKNLKEFKTIKTYRGGLKKF